MPFKIVKCVYENTDQDDFFEAVTTDAVYINGYSFGERQLEDIPFRITTNGTELFAEMLLSESLQKRMCIDKAQAEKDAIAFALENDVFSASPDLSDDDGLIIRTDLSAREQMFSCPESFSIDGAVYKLPIN